MDINNKGFSKTDKDIIFDNANGRCQGQDCDVDGGK